MSIISIRIETFINTKGVDSNMMWAGSVKVGMDTKTGKDEWDTKEAEQLYKKLFGLDREYHYADPGRDLAIEKAERSKQLGGLEISMDLIRNYQAKSICRHCWAIRSIGMCIYGFKKVKVRKPIWRKRWERKEIIRKNVSSVKRVMDWNKYHRGLKKVYGAYRKGMFRSRWTLYKLLNQLIDKCSKNEVVVYETIAEEKWIFKGWESVPVEFELVCPLRILFRNSDFLVLDEKEVWDFEPPQFLRRKRWGVGVWDNDSNNNFLEITDHFVDQVILDDDEREYQEEDRVDNSETIEETETEEQKDQYVCDNCSMKDTCKYAYDPYCKFECLADK